MTLPLIYLRELSPDPMDCSSYNIEIVNDKISKKIYEYLGKARHDLDRIPDSGYKQCLKNLVRGFEPDSKLKHNKKILTL